MRDLRCLAIVAALSTLVDNLLLGAVILGAGGIAMAPFALAVLIAPSLFVAPLGARLVDRYGIQRSLHVAKLLELVALAAFWFLAPTSWWLTGVALFIAGSKSALLAPVKYASAARMGSRDDKVLKASMLVATTTAVSIVIGIFGGYYLLGLGGMIATVVALAGLSLVGWLLVPFTGKVTSVPAEPAALGLTDRTRTLAMLGIGWFWFVATMLIGEMVPYAMGSLAEDASLALLLVTTLAFGFVIGALTCSRLSRGVLELGVVPVGALGITVFTAFLWFGGMLTSPKVTHAYAIAVACGVSLAWFVVPLYALVHQRTDSKRIATVAARGDQVSSAFAILAALVLVAVRGLPGHWMFLAISAMNAAVAFFIYAYAPEFALRLVVWLLAHVLYRVRVIGRENLPLHGPAVLVCNHVTFVDWLIIGSASPQPLRFVMHYSFMNIPVAKYLFRDAKIIPIAGAKEDPETLEKAFERIAAALADNEIVCIFPEGKLTTDGKMNVFRPGIEKIITRTPVPVVPMALVGMWGSMFSKSRDKGVGKRIWSKVTLLVEPALQPALLTATDLEQRVRRLGQLP